VVLQELHQSEYFCQSENTEYFKYASTFKDDLKFWSNVARESRVVLVTSLLRRGQQVYTIIVPLSSIVMEL